MPPPFANTKAWLRGKKSKVSTTLQPSGYQQYK
jgi:hypothetical protein